MDGNPVDVDANGQARPPVGDPNGTIGAANDGGDAATLTVTKVNSTGRRPNSVLTLR